MNSESDNTESNPLDELRARADSLERMLGEVRQEASSRILRAELRAEAVRAGMIDLDYLKLLDQSSLKLSPGGDVEGAAPLLAQLRKSKPWLFMGASSSSAAPVPLAQAPKQKRATEMTEAEYRAARAELLKRRY